jgi:polyisoprenoid-binding protein YceI
MKTNTNFLLALFILVLNYSFGQEINLNTSNVQVSFNYLDEKTEGTIKNVSAFVKINPLDLGQSKIEGKAFVKSLSTGNPARDSHLKSKTYFDQKKYPEMTFVSETIQKVDNHYTVTGTLTIKGFKKPVTFILTMDNSKLTLKGSIYTYDFGVGIKKERDLSLLEIQIIIPLEQDKK